MASRSVIPPQRRCPVSVPDGQAQLGRESSWSGVVGHASTPPYQLPRGARTPVVIRRQAHSQQFAGVARDFHLDVASERLTDPMSIRAKRQEFISVIGAGSWRRGEAPRDARPGSQFGLKTLRRMIDFCCVTSRITSDMLSRLLPLALLPPPKGSSAARNPPEALMATWPVLSWFAT